MDKDREIFIVDTFGFLFRSFYAIPPLYNRDGVPTNLLTGFVKLIQQFQKLFSIQKMVFALEGGDNFRKEISKDYKSNREQAPEEFRFQAEVVLSWIEKMGFPTIQDNRYEADDIIASLSKIYSEKGYRVYILSADKDFIQLLDEVVSIIKPESMKIFGVEDAIKKYKIYPSKFIDYQALVGDAVDNVPGVAGIGKKSAENLLNQFERLEDIYNNLDKIRPSISKKLQAGKELAFQSRELVTLKRDLKISPLPDTSSIPDEPLKMIVDELIDYELEEALKYLQKKGEVTKEYIERRENKNFEFEYITIRDIERLREVVSKIEDGTLIAFDTETTGVDVWSDKIVGFSFTDRVDKGYYIPIRHNFLGVEEQISEDELRDILEEFKRFRLVGHNFKFDKHIIYNTFGVELPLFADTIILAWLKNPSKSLSLDNLAYTLLKHKTIKFKDIVPKGENFSSVDFESASKYAVEDVVVTLRLFYKFEELLSDNLFSMGLDFEVQLSELLYHMEREGISVDIDRLKTVEIDFNREIEDIKREIFALAGGEFNLNSPKQVAEILFDRLKIPSKKRATDEMTLKSINGDYPIIEKILKYRELFKIVSTYLIPLQKYGKVGRVKTTFIQTGTATGRLSSKNPNLQNIPVESGVRNGFVSKDCYSLLSLDYSQIELRFFAHFSEDSEFTKAFQNGEDIHLMVAKKLGVDRKVAKTVNFGLLYGMGYKKLAYTLNIKDEEAKEILKNYFKMFPDISKFQDRVNERLSHNWFIETILGRRRYFRPPTSQREEALIYREAFNTLFQGSSADLIKMAMVKIGNLIDREGLDVKPLLQIHDELIFEVRDKFISEYSQKFRDIMERAIPLNVPLVVNSKSGKSWGEMF